MKADKRAAQSMNRRFWPGRAEPIDEPGLLTDMRRSLVGQFARFLSVGAVGTAIQYLILAALVEFFGIGTVAASSAGMFAGALVNYLLNRHFVFQSDVGHGSAIMRFLSVAVVAFLANGVLMVVLTNGPNLPYLLAQLIATGAVTILTFTAHRAWTFAGRAL